MHADVARRALALIADGLVDRDGVGGLARRLGYSERQLHRILVAELGAGAISLARTQRAHAAKLLLDCADLSIREIALAAGFGSIRQFNATMRTVYGITPSQLRTGPRPASGIRLRLPANAPFDGPGVVRFLQRHEVPGLERVSNGAYIRALALEHGGGLATLTPEPDALICELKLDDLRDLTAAVARCRRLLDLDADPVSISTQLGADPILGELVARRPGMRVPGCVDGFELAVRAIVGQQVSVPAARTVLGRLATRYGEPLPEASGPITHRFPTAQTLAEVDPAELPFPRKRGEALRSVALLVAAGELSFDAGADSTETLAALLDIPGIGAWTASYVAMRALGDPDAFLAGDVGIRHALHALGQTSAGPEIAEAWRPWRSYAVMHLWASVSGEPGGALRVDDADELAEHDVCVDQVQAPLRRGRRPEDRRAA
jgi:AraC family transcriptional regulator, regulatory protein of adaptative response / DNA-3-methyladenine glycosylase II